MADPCIVKSGEVVVIGDPRLSDTGCTVETGVIIRTPADPSVALPAKPAPRPALKPVPKPVQVVAVPVVEKPPEKVMDVERFAEFASPRVTKPALQATVVQQEPTVKEETPSMDPTTLTTLTVGAVAVAGAAAASSALGGFSAIQAKVASLFGAKATVVTAATVTVGTIVAVKALESKMNKLEVDLDKTRKEVGETSAAADRIDELLSRLGS